MADPSKLRSANRKEQQNEVHVKFILAREESCGNTDISVKHDIRRQLI
jgi:hypothetical protein